MQQGDDPPYLSVGTEVSAKYKGAFCEAKVRKVVRNIKCKVTFKQGLGTSAVTDEQIKGTLRVGVTVEARHPDRREFVEAVITKIQDCSQYTVVFDDGDITTLRRSALCLKSGRHFNESETLDQLPLTHPEHFGNPVIGGRRGRRSRQLQEDSDDDDEETLSTTGGHSVEKEEHIGKVVCVETSDSKKRLPKETWFPGLVVAPTAQVTVRIRVRDEYLVRSFKDGRYYTVPKKEATEFTRELASRQEGPAVTAALRYLDNDDLPPHWDRDALFGLSASSNSDSEDGVDTDSSADEPIEEKDHFVAQLYKFMDDRGTPFNQDPIVANRDIDLYRLFSAVQKLGGYSRVTGHNQWKAIAGRLGFTRINTSLSNLVKQAYKKYLHSFDEFYRKLGCTMISHTRGVRTKGRSLIRNTPTPSPRQQDTPPVDVTEVAVVTDEQEKTKIGRPGRSKPENAESPQEPEEVLKTKARVIIAKKIKELKVEVKAEYDAVSTLDTDSTTSPDQPSLMICQPEIETPYKGVSKGKAIMPIVKIKEEPKDISELVVTVEKKKVKAKKKTPGGKVKALINKYEEKVKQVDSDEPDIKEVKDEPLSIASTSQQNTRSKSKDEIKVNKEPIAPELKIVKIIPVKEKEKEREVEVVEIDVKVVELKDKDKEKEKVKEGDKEKDKVKKPDDAGGDKRRGRKRKETDTADNKESLEPQMIAKGISIDVGDKLKVFYHESKVTYEAKVIEIDLERSEHSYLVHYTGWNTRYDEWVRRDRIAENLSAGGKAKRLKGQGHNKSSSKPPSALKRGRGLSSTGRPPGTDGPPNLPPRSTTPSSVTSSSSRTKSPATPGSVVARRVTRQQDVSGRTRGRRTSVQTDISLASGSDSDGASSDMETDTKPPPNKRSTSKSSSHDEGNKEAPPNAGKGKRKPQKKLSDDLLLSEIKGNIKKIKEEPGEEEDSDDETLHKGRDFDLNQIRSELKGFKEVVKAPTAEEKENEVTSRLILDDKTGLIDVQRKSEDLLNETQKEETIKKELVKVEKTPEKVSSVADIYEFKEPEPFEFEARKPVSEEKKKRPVGRIFEEMPELKLDKLPKRKMPVKVTSKTSNEGGKKGSKTTVEKIEDCDVEAPTLTPQKQSSSPDMFDKLCESPSFNLNKSASPVLVAMEPGSCTSTTLEMESLSIFDEIETTEDSGDRLVMLESEDTNIVSNEEPLFTYQQELFPSIEDKTSRLLPLFPGLRQDTFLTKSEDGTKSNKDSSSSEEDPIDAAIQRVISQTLCDEDSQEIDLLLKKESSIFEPTASNVEIVLIEKPVLLEINAKSEMTDTVTENIDIFDQENIMPGTSIIDKLKAITDGATLLDELESDSKGSDNDNSITLMSVKVQDDKTEVLTKTLKTLLPVKRPEKLEFVKKELFMRSDCAKNDAGKSITKVMDNVEKDAVNSQLIVQKNNVLNETILKLETAMQQSGSVSLPELESSFQDESSDSTDSEQRLIIDKLSDDEGQQTDSNSCGSLHKKIELAIISLPVECPEIATSDAPKTESSEPQSSNEIKTEETVVETKVEKVDSEPETESNICLLLCEETIPGSPAPLTCDAQPVQETVTKTKPKSAKSLQMELPFASAVNIGGKGNQNKTKESTKTVQVVTVKSVESFVPPNPVTSSHKDSDNLDRPLDNSPPNTPESTLSNLSPRDERVLSPMEVRKVRDSSSMELDSGAESSAPLGVPHRAPARGPAGNVGHGGMSEDDSRPGLSKKLDADCDTSPKKRRRSRKASECESSAGSCSGANPPGTNPPGANPPGTKRTRRITRVTSDSDTSEAILRERERDTSGRPNRYNFTVQLDPSLDSNQRISLLMQTMEELRKNYNRVKSELMGYERKRKKLRRREREAVKAAKTAEISV